jgi:hypothetical protein
VTKTWCALCLFAAAIIGATAWAQVPVKTQKTFAECVADPKPYLAMDWQNFDQGVAPDGREWGWREISNKPGCETAAADLMAMWMKENRDTLGAKQQLFMTFHEGQVRAMGGDFAKGAEMIEAGRAFWDKPEGVAYVDAILAFLRGDRAGLMAARERMMAVPEPPNFARTQKAFCEQAGWEPKWPMNIEAVDKMIACWGKGYTGGSQGDCEWRPAN